MAQRLCRACHRWPSGRRSRRRERPTPPGTPLFLVAMEPLTGGRLWDRLQPDQPLPPELQLLAACDLMAGLMALHSLGFAHSDLK